MLLPTAAWGGGGSVRSAPVPDSQDLDDEWDDRPAPVTAVAIRLEEAAVDAVRELAAPRGVSAADLLRRWVMERLEAELAPAPAPEATTPPATKKVAARPKVAAPKKAPAAKRAAPATKKKPTAAKKKAAARRKA